MYQSDAKSGSEVYTRLGDTVLIKITSFLDDIPLGVAIFLAGSCSAASRTAYY